MTDEMRPKKKDVLDRISGAVRNWVNPESTFSADQRQKIKDAENRAKFKAIKNARIKQIKAKYGYNPKKPGTGWGGNILDSMGAAARNEFGGKQTQSAFIGNLEGNLPKQQRKTSHNESSGFGGLLNEGDFMSPILDEGGLQPIHLQKQPGMIKPPKKRPSKVINIY